MVMTPSQISTAIEYAQSGIARYLEIMERFPQTDVSRDSDFQRLFNGFYKVRQRSPVWYEEYYSYMESQKGKSPTFSSVLRHLYATVKRYEPSFSSKLIATINPNSPIWDSVVLRHANIKPPLYTSPTKVKDAIDCHSRLQEWHERQMRSEGGQLMIALFREMVPEHERISDLKKIDFVLWQSRE